MEGVIEKAMAKDPSQRFSTVKALSDALNAIAGDKTPDLENMDKTLLVAARDGASKRPEFQTKTVLAKKGGEIAPVPAAARKKTGMWIGLGGLALLVCVAAVGGGFALFKDKLPFGASSTATVFSSLRRTDTPEANQATLTSTVGVIPPLGASDSPTPTLTLTSTPTVQGLPVTGGADLIAFLGKNDIWVMGVDGSNLTQITKDGGVKNDLQWSPDGQSLFYISGKCIHNVTVPAGEEEQVTCFTAADYLDAFEISPDGTQVAISLNRVLFVVPFDLSSISTARTWIHLENMKGCFTYGNQLHQTPPMGVRWSNDGTKLAINALTVDGSGRRVDLISLFDISNCDSTAPAPKDNFPGARFVMTGYDTNPKIPSFDTDGETLFVLNSKIRYDLGGLYAYNLSTKHGEKLDPLKTACCYSSARFSPDGSFLLFAYQNPAEGQNAITNWYYVSYGSIGTGATIFPLPLPKDFPGAANDHLDATLRPAQR